jgi:hypothetical protein
MKIAVVSSAALISGAFAAQAATDVLASKEYKVLLTPSNFNAQPLTAANQFLSELKTNLKNAGSDRTIDSTFSDDEVRAVRFYNSPGTCRLKNAGYMLRTRGDTAGGEVTLKFRSSSPSIAAASDVSASVSDAKTKFEDDIMPPFNETFSHSTTEGLSATKNLNILVDVTDLFPGTRSLNLPKKDTLSLVGNLDIIERIYAGPSSDLGSSDADFSLTLWFVGNALTPAVAEMSFKVKADNGDFTGKVTDRSKLLFDTMRAMNLWVSMSTITKTEWVYQYQPSFCTGVQTL